MATFFMCRSGLVWAWALDLGWVIRPALWQSQPDKSPLSGKLIGTHIAITISIAVALFDIETILRLLAEHD